MTTAAKKGNLFLIKFATTFNGVDYTTVVALQDTTMTINNTSVDITNKSSSGWQELLAGGGVHSIDVTGNGVFSNDTTQKILVDAVLASTQWAVQITDEAGSTWTGNWHVNSTELGGASDAEQTFSVSLSSADQITYVSA